ncbi:MAG TPA: C25 family cysteine peptidase, partial [Pyrinomonadaceae bacterium]
MKATTRAKRRLRLAIGMGTLTFLAVLLTVSAYTRRLNSNRSEQRSVAAVSAESHKKQIVQNEESLFVTRHETISPLSPGSDDSLLEGLERISSFNLPGSLFANASGGNSNGSGNSRNKVDSKPKELRMERAQPFHGDLRDLPYRKPVKKERPEREEPERILGTLETPTGGKRISPAIGPSVGTISPAAPAPGTIANFDGLDFATWGNGHPPDTNGDVGPTYYIQTVNTSIGIYNKTGGAPVAAFTFDNFMSQGNFGNLCDTDNFGDPVVVYDTFEDRWIISDFAFQLDIQNNVINPPGAFQCFAVSKTGDPVSGGWNFYSINTTGGLGDYPKLGIWPDGLYMSVNMFDYAAAGSFQNVRLYAFNKLQMYAGYPTIQVVSFDLPSSEFTLLPSNARLQTGTPPTGTPNYFSTVDFFNALTVWKFHVDWNSISLSTFTGPFDSATGASFALAPDTVPSNGGNPLDTLQPRMMVQNQYSNISGVESLWNSHTVQGGSASQAAVRYYQLGVTGGTVAANTTQAFTHNPDTTNRFMPSVAVDRAGDMALGYSTSSSTLFPAIKYAGRLSVDAVNSLPQTETSLINGTGTQSGSCGGSTCTRWGDYSAMSLDPDGCTFWYTNEYYAVTGLNDLTRIGSFKFPSCTPVTSGTVSGTVTATLGGAPISFATVALGSRTTSTDGSGFYSFTGVPSGIYPTETASANGYNSSTTTNIVVTDGLTTTQNFSLATAPTSGCFLDTTQADFQTGVPTTVDLTTSAGNVTLLRPITVDQQNTSLSNSGFGFSTTTWAGQTFTVGVTGTLERADINLFCSGCTGTAPNLTLSVRATSGGLPTGADLASTTLTGNPSGAASYFSGTFSIPPSLTAGTQYALVVRPVSNPSAGTYAITVSSSGSNPYANGERVASNNSGTSWSAPNPSRDVGFHTYMKTGFAAAGDQVSSLKDANPDVHSIANWTTLSWTATTPPNTTLRFQVAGSLVPSGPFNFVGPDGTAATFFTTSGASLSQFNGLRYLKYKAFLSTTDSAVTPTLNDVTVCFSTSANPTAVKLTGFTAASFSDGVQLNWESGYEVNNLGYHLYREQQGQRTRVTPAVVAGSALSVGPGSRLTAGSSYSWFDQRGTAETAYYLEAIDLNGARQWTGPLYPYGGTSNGKSPKRQRALLLNELAESSTASGANAESAWPVAMKAEARRETLNLEAAGLAVQQSIAAGKAVKIQVNRTGWYRLSQAELVAAGLDPSSDARLLQLYVDGAEVPIELSSNGVRLDASDTLEFYGVALDTPTTDTRTYWLITGESAGKRISGKRGKAHYQNWTEQPAPGSFLYTTERREKLIYSSHLLNGDAENIFGAPIFGAPLKQTVTVNNLDGEASSPAQLELALQGLTTQGHEVQVQFNGGDVGTVSFSGSEHKVAKFNLNRALLHNGDNEVSLVARNGDLDISFVDAIRLTYAHKYRADNNALGFSVPAGQRVRVDGFSSAEVRVIDVTDPASPLEVATSAAPSADGFAVLVPVFGSEARTLVAFTDDLSRHPASVAANNPSSWNASTNGADLVIITHQAFRQAIEPLAALRQSQGLSVAVVDVEDVYDEFSYGAHTPAALKSFLWWTASHWSRAPHYLLLVGDSSWDPRNYFDQGAND